MAFLPDSTWLATDGGLVRIDRQTGARLVVGGLPSDRITRLLSTPDGLWVGMQTGLAFYDTAAGKVTATAAEFDGTNVAYLLAEPGGAIWASSYVEDRPDGGLLGRFDGASWRIWRPGGPPLPAGGGDASALGIDEQDYVWVAAGSNVSRWDGESWQHWTSDVGAPAGTVYTFAFHDGEMWMGGHLDGRLFGWSGAGWQSQKPDGLSGDVLEMRFADDGALWLATTDGLLRYEP